MRKACKAFFAVTSVSVLILLYASNIYIADVDMDGSGTNYLKSYFNNQSLNNNLTIVITRHRAKTQPQERLEERIKARADLLVTECKRLMNNTSQELKKKKPSLTHIIVNDKHKLLYCYVPKVACTNLKRVFLILTGKMNVTDPLQIRSRDVHATFKRQLTYLSNFTQTEIEYRLKKYKKIIFVREPLQRLLSAYRDKFFIGGNPGFRKGVGRDIIKMFRENPSNESLETGFDVRFPEFVEYITHAKSYNEHWKSYYNLCKPCYIQYDFIGKYETLNEDVDLLLKQISVDNMMKFPRRNETYTALRTEETMKDFYAKVNPEKIQNLQEIYSKDYSVFGFKLKTIL